jgi:hypothetical protein
VRFRLTFLGTAPRKGARADTIGGKKRIFLRPSARVPPACVCSPIAVKVHSSGGLPLFLDSAARGGRTGVMRNAE